MEDCLGGEPGEDEKEKVGKVEEDVIKEHCMHI
jgi:hypothetical protein